MLGRECRFGIKNLEEVMRFYKEVPEILDLIQELGWKDKRTIKALRTIKKLLDEVQLTLAECFESVKHYQRTTAKIFEALDEVGLTEVASELIVAKRKLNNQSLKVGRLT